MPLERGPIAPAAPGTRFASPIDRQIPVRWKDDVMKATYAKPGLQVQFDFHQCQLSQAEIDQIYGDLGSLERQVINFPIHDLHIMVEHNSRSNDFSVKTTLLLPGATLVGNDHDPVVHAAFMRCLAGLEENVRAYKERMDLADERNKQEKHTHQDLQPTLDPDFAALDAAAAEGDYGAFRAALLGYEEPVRRRAGRWVERYPEVDQKIGRGLDVEDIVEATFLEAFDAFERRPNDVRFGDWLENLIDAAVRSLRGGADDYLDNIRLARSAREAEQGPAAR